MGAVGWGAPRPPRPPHTPCPPRPRPRPRDGVPDRLAIAVHEVDRLVDRPPRAVSRPRPLFRVCMTIWPSEYCFRSVSDGRPITGTLDWDIQICAACITLIKAKIAAGGARLENALSPTTTADHYLCGWYRQHIYSLLAAVVDFG